MLTHVCRLPEQHGPPGGGGQVGTGVTSGPRVSPASILATPPSCKVLVGGLPPPSLPEPLSCSQPLPLQPLPRASQYSSETSSVPTVGGACKGPSGPPVSGGEHGLHFEDVGWFGTWAWHTPCISTWPRRPSAARPSCPWPLQGHTLPCPQAPPRPPRGALLEQLACTPRPHSEISPRSPAQAEPGVRSSRAPHQHHACWRCTPRLSPASGKWRQLHQHRAQGNQGSPCLARVDALSSVVVPTLPLGGQTPPPQEVHLLSVLTSSSTWKGDFQGQSASLRRLHCVRDAGTPRSINLSRKALRQAGHQPPSQMSSGAEGLGETGRPSWDANPGAHRCRSDEQIRHRCLSRELRRPGDLPDPASVPSVMLAPLQASADHPQTCPALCKSREASPARGSTQELTDLAEESLSPAPS